MSRFDGESSNRPMYPPPATRTMGRYSFLPDPFVAELRRIPGFRELTEGYTLCPECERCERSVVYLSPRERAAAVDSGRTVYGTGGGSRLNRQGCRCPFYLGPSRGCAAYEDRPLICNLFPLDIIEREEDGQYWWVLFGACEEVARGKLPGTSRRGAGIGQRDRPADARRSQAGLHGGCGGSPVRAGLLRAPDSLLGSADSTPQPSAVSQVSEKAMCPG